MFYYLLAAPFMLAGIVIICLGLFAGCVLIVERGSPFEEAALSMPNIIAGSACLVILGATCEVVALKLVA